MRGRFSGFNVVPPAKCLWFPPNSVFSTRRHTINNTALLHCTDKRRGEKVSQPKRKFFFPINCFKPPGWLHGNTTASFEWCMKWKVPAQPAESSQRVLCHRLYALLFDVVFSQVRTTKAWQLLCRWGMSLFEHWKCKSKVCSAVYGGSAELQNLICICTK